MHSEINFIQKEEKLHEFRLQSNEFLMRILNGFHELFFCYKCFNQKIDSLCKVFF